MSLWGTIGNIVKGAGTILSMVPVIGPLVGGAITSVGGAILANNTGTIDVVTAASNATIANLKVSNAMLSAGASQTSANTLMGGVASFVQNNLLIIILAVGAVWYFFFRGKKRKKR
jgi:hypothetical protein